MSTTHVTYTGTAPAADAASYVLFDTTVASPNARNFFALAGIQRFRLEMKNSEAGTTVASWSENGGTTWNVYDSVATVAATATVTNGVDYNVGNYRDWKLTWTNGGVAQATWIIAMSMSTDQASVV